MLVVYFSRSGTTETMAQAIARHLKGNLVELRAEDYGLGLGGYLSAAWDAIWRKQGRITPERVDLSPYRLVFLGSPIWYWRPAPPLWRFVERNELKGLTVVPFFTMKSDYGETSARELCQKIEAKGARCPGHLPLRHHGELGEAVTRKTEELLEKNKSWWAEAVGHQK
ncbi:MAG: hypothetical protein AB1405_12880 [Bdellovibrionota bacterium]